MSVALPPWKGISGSSRPALRAGLAQRNAGDIVVELGDVHRAQRAGSPCHRLIGLSSTASSTMRFSSTSASLSVPTLPSLKESLKDSVFGSNSISLDVDDRPRPPARSARTGRRSRRRKAEMLRRQRPDAPVASPADRPPAPRRTLSLPSFQSWTRCSPFSTLVADAGRSLPPGARSLGRCSRPASIRWSPRR